MKPVTKQQFDSLLEKRINIATRAFKEILTTAENNPSHLSPELVGKVSAFIDTTAATFKASLEAIVNQPTIGGIGEFSLGGEKKPRKPREARPRTPAPAPVPAAPVAESLETSDDKPARPKARETAVEARTMRAAAPAPADSSVLDDLSIEDLMADVD